MGLMLSILVICVGVIEAISCYEHFQYGVIHCATNIYESARRSSLFLNYTSTRLGLLAKESAPELNGKHGKSFKPFRSFDESVCISEEGGLSHQELYRYEHIEISPVVKRSEKKLEKQDKIDIVKKHFERPVIRRPKPVRSISMPELTYTEEEIELSKMINDLAIEPIEEVDVEIETNSEVLVKEFEELFSEYEKSTPLDKRQTAQDLKCPIKPIEEKVEVNSFEKGKTEILVQDHLNNSSNESSSKKEIGTFSELQEKFSRGKTCSKSFSDKTSDPEPAVPETYSKEALVKQYLSQVPESRSLKRSVSAFENKTSSAVTKNISPVPTEQNSDSPMPIPTTVIPFNKSFDFDEDPLNKLTDVILENETPPNASVEMIDKTFEEIYGDLSHESLDVMNMYKEIEENIANELEEGEERDEGDIDFNSLEPPNRENSSVKIVGGNIPQEVFLKAIDQLADLIVKDCLKELRNLPLEHLSELKSASKDINNDVKELKLENRTMNKPELEHIERADSKTTNTEISKHSGKQALVQDDEILTKHVPNEENPFLLSEHTENLVIDQVSATAVATTVEPEHSKISDKSEYGILIDFEDGTTARKTTADYSPDLKDSSIPILNVSQPESNKETENCSFTCSDLVQPELKPPLSEKTPLLAIKGEILPAIEYKSKTNDNNQQIKKEIIPMEWKTEINEENAIAKNLPEVSGDLSKIVLAKPILTKSENENSLNCLKKEPLYSNKDYEGIKESEPPSTISEHFSMEPDGNSKSTDEATDVKGESQTLESQISKPTGDVEKEAKKTMAENFTISSPVSEPTKIENVTPESNTPVNKNTQLLAIKNEVLLSLEYKNDKHDTNQDNKNEIISMEWKTEFDKSVNGEECGRDVKEDLMIWGMKPAQRKERVDEPENNSEEPTFSSKNNVKTVNLTGNTAISLDTVIAEVSPGGDFKPEDISNCTKQNSSSEELKIARETSSGDVTKTDILKPNLDSDSKPNADASQSLSADCSSPVETITVVDCSAWNENNPKSEDPVEIEKEKKTEHSNDSKKLNARNNNKEVKDTNSAPEAFWLIFSGEYTKAMSKDWHSGHFSCWQCDEALTGQRYVLRDDHPYCIKCYESVFANVCEECNKIIGIDSKDLSYKDKHWHEACFLCNKCRVSLVDKQFGSKADKIYCGNCYDAQFASRCDGCGEIFRAGTKKMEYKTRQWHEKCFCCCVCKTPIGTKSFIPREQEIYCATCYEEKFATRCVKCNKIITSGGVTYKNEPWHRECFTCTNCNTSLAGQRFTSRDEKPYCADCFGELFAKRCTACSRPITGIGGTRFISFEDRHWHNDCFICASCKTSLVGRGFITDGDDIICPECAKQKLM